MHCAAARIKAVLSGRATPRSMQVLMAAVPIVAVLTAHAVAVPIPLIERQKLLRVGEIPAHDAFGGSVSLSGDTLVAGAYSDVRPSSFDSGAAYVYSRVGNNWVQTQTLAPAGSGHSFAQHVEIDGDFMAVSARGRPTNPRGAVYIYERTGSSWSLDDIVPAPVVGAFARSMDLSGNRLIVGAYAAKRAVVFERVQGQWVEQTQFTADTFRYGAMVGIDGDTAVVGGEYGGLDVYRYSAGQWSFDGNLAPVVGDSFASIDHSNVVLDAGRIVVGGTQLSGGGIYVFEKVGRSWTQTALLQSGAIGGTGGKWAVDIEGDWLAGGAFVERQGGVFDGRAYLFQRTANGWNLKYELVGSDIADSRTGFGYTISLDGEEVIVGGRPFSVTADSYQRGVYSFLVPEPSTSLLAGLGLAGLLSCAVWRRHAPWHSIGRAWKPTGSVRSGDRG